MFRRPYQITHYRSYMMTMLKASALLLQLSQAPHTIGAFRDILLDLMIYKDYKADIYGSSNGADS